MIDFVIVSNKRTGSTFLQEALNSHPNITCYDELFLIRNNSNNKRKNFDLFVDTKLSVPNYLEYIPKNGVTGFKVVYPQLYKWDKLLDYIKDKNIPVIHLIRSNWFEQSMSWHTKYVDYNSRDVSLYINPDKLKWRMDKVKEETEYFKDHLQYNNYIEVFYEDMFGNVEGKRVNVKKMGAFNIWSKQITYLSDKYVTPICNFLGVNKYSMHSNLTKRTRFDVWDYIENKEEIRKIVW